VVKISNWTASPTVEEQKQARPGSRGTGGRPSCAKHKKLREGCDMSKESEVKDDAPR
jgi:hypothetical protein